MKKVLLNAIIITDDRFRGRVHSLVVNSADIGGIHRMIVLKRVEFKFFGAGFCYFDVFYHVLDVFYELLDLGCRVVLAVSFGSYWVFCYLLGSKFNLF